MTPGKELELVAPLPTATGQCEDLLVQCSIFGVELGLRHERWLERVRQERVAGLPKLAIFTPSTQMEPLDA